jgi:hypothetical protein
VQLVCTVDKNQIGERSTDVDGDRARPRSCHGPQPSPSHRPGSNERPRGGAPKSTSAAPQRRTRVNVRLAAAEQYRFGRWT